MTYYHYKDGQLIGTTEEDPIIGCDYAQPVTTPQQPAGDVVGAYLASHNSYYPAFTVPNSDYQVHSSHTSHQQANAIPSAPTAASSSYPSPSSYESQTYRGPIIPDHSNTRGYVGNASLSGLERPYQDPEQIRHMHTLHSILPYIQPERKLHALNGPTMDIIEQDTSIVFAYAVPKKLLVLFLGRKIVNKFIRTLAREDNETWTGGPVRQALFLPRRQSSKCAMQILLSWMIRACQRHSMGSIHQINIPTNTFAACSLAQTMELFALHKDALRVDFFIARCHFTRPVYAVELHTLWHCLGEGSRYVYAAVKAVGKRLQEYDRGEERALPNAEEMLELLESEPRLAARVRDLEGNETYRPKFGTKWMKELHGGARLGKAEDDLDSSDELREKDGGENEREHEKQDTEASAVGDTAQGPLPELGKGRRVGVLRIVAEPSSSDEAATEQAGTGEDSGKEEAKL